MSRVSFLMAVFNGDEYLRPCVQSLLGQDYGDFDIVIVDDGSTDSSPKILEEFRRANEEKIKIYRIENSGLSAALNFGITKCKGEWIARMDADDICEPSRLSNQMAWMKTSGADIGGGYLRTIGAVRTSVWRYPTTHDGIVARLLFNSPFAHPAVICRRTLLERIAYRSSEMPGEDYDLWSRVAIAGWRMTNCPEVILNYRIHDKQISAEKWGRQVEKREEVARSYWLHLTGNFEPQSVYSFSTAREMRKMFSQIERLGFGGEAASEIDRSIGYMITRSLHCGSAAVPAIWQYKIGMSLGKRLLYSTLLLLFFWVSDVQINRLKRLVRP